jgi:hypothetical protein
MHFTKKMKLLNYNFWLHRLAPVRDKSLPKAVLSEAVIVRHAVVRGKE